MKSTLFILFLAMIFSSTAWAQSKEPSTSGKRVRVGKTVYDFDEVDITGRLKKPEGGMVNEVLETSFRRLLDLDESFLPNVVRGVDEF